MFDTNVYKISTTERPKLIEGDTKGLSDSDAVEEDEENQPKLSAEEIMKVSDESLEAAGFKVAKTFKEYYKYKIYSSVQEKIPNLLPYNLNLTILGIASLNVGDTFKIDYLPDRYIESTYLQIMKVTHEIGPGGWYTALDTQFRLLPKLTNIVNPTNQDEKIRLSPTALTNVGYEDEIEADAGFWSYGNDVKIADLAQYMTDIKVEYNEAWAYDYALDFKMARQLEGEIKQESGYILNRRGNFKATFEDKTKRDAALLEPGSAFSGAHGRGDPREHSYYYSGKEVWPPDFQLVPNKRYTMLVYGDKIGVLEHENIYYKEQLQFFKKYVGHHTNHKTT